MQDPNPKANEAPDGGGGAQQADPDGYGSHPDSSSETPASPPPK